MTSTQNYKIDYVSSKDGTKIGYRQLGDGPGLILVHGGMMSSLNFMKLGELLANEFTVYIPDRRGRGLSMSQNNNYSLSKEGEDMQALINKTNTQNIFGLSSGAIITLYTAIMEPAIKKFALYEPPPIPVNGKNSIAFVDDYEMAMSEGNLGRAMIIIMNGTGETSLFSILPGFITIPIMNFLIKADAKEDKGDDKVALKTLISTWHNDIIAVFESEGIINKCKDITADILLLGGQKSPLFLKDALDALSTALPQAKRIEISNVGHLAPENGGKPEVVAKELQKYFLSSFYDTDLFGAVQ
jgi:pimeloyl-ACP methyl ester carboxylesterase